MSSKLVSFLFCVLSLHFFAQLKTIKPVKTHPKHTNFGIGVGYTRSVIFLSRNVKENNDANGIQISAVYGGAKLFRFSGEYSYYFPITIEPTWFNIKAKTFEINTHIIARFKNSDAFFYPLFGLSANYFTGYFTGQNDFQNLADKYKINTTISTNWVGINIGTGYEYYVKPVSLFFDYKMRVGLEENKRALNIMDVCLIAGLRYNIKVPSIYNLYRGTKSRYMLN